MIVIIMTHGGAFSLTELFHLNAGLTFKKSTHLVKSREVRVVITLSFLYMLFKLCMAVVRICKPKQLILSSPS